jgi:hypothetical protein
MGLQNDELRMTKPRKYTSVAGILRRLYAAKLERMPNDQMTKRGDAVSCSLCVRASFVIRSPRRSLAKAGHRSFVICWSVLVIVIGEMYCTAMAQAQSANVTGKWNVEVSLGAGRQHSVRFEAQGDGKGTFVLMDRMAKAWGVDKTSAAKWTRAEGDSVTFSGPMEFPLGNVGRDAGTLTCKGKFETADLITGEVEFSPLVGDGPSKVGTFKAVRAKE